MVGKHALGSLFNNKNATLRPAVSSSFYSIYRQQIYKESVCSRTLNMIAVLDFSEALWIRQVPEKLQKMQEKL